MGDSGTIGEELLSNVPEDEQKYWIIRSAVAEGYFTFDEALEAYGMTKEEFEACKKKLKAS
jgi:hypothetical protein